jgi:hypothetical protein
MKKIIFFAAMLISVLAFKNANAQLNVSLNLNIGVQPTWGPVGYDHVEYYYLPDIDCYYYVPGRRFIYFNGIRWVKSITLPPRYSTYDLYSGYKVVINEETPYLRNNIYRARYAPFRNRRGQSIIRDSHDNKYRPQPGRPGNPGPRPQPGNRPGNPGPRPQPGNGNNRPGNPGPRPQPGNGNNRPGNPGQKPGPRPQPGQGDNRPGGDRKP